jgi:hypothetical protein
MRGRSNKFVPAVYEVTRNGKEEFISVILRRPGVAATEHSTHRRRRLPAKVGVVELAPLHPACQLLQKLAALPWRQHAAKVLHPA